MRQRRRLVGVRSFAMPAPSSNAPSPLRQRAFRAIWIAAIFSYVGTWVQDVGESWLMLSMTKSPLLVAMLTTSFTLPYTALTLPAGALSDRSDRRTLLLGSHAFLAFVAFSLAILTWLHVMHPYVLLLASVGLGLGSAVAGPPWQTLVPELVPRRQTAEAITLNSIAFNIARATGPALGGFLIGLWGAGWAFLLNAMSFLAVGWVVWRFPEIRRASEAPREVPAHARGESLLASMRAPFRVLLNSRRLPPVFLALAAFSVAAASSASILPAFAKHTLDATATGYGALLGAMGLGAITGGLVAKRARALFGPRVIVASAMMLYGASTLAASAAHSVTAATCFFFPLGMGWLMTLSTLNALCQLLAPSWVKSRLLALYQMTFMVVWSVGASFGGLLAERFAERASMVAGGVGTLAAGALVVMLKLPDTERELTGDVTPTPAPARTSM